MIKNLTEGRPGRVLIGYSLPMFISVIFQQMYNIADSVIAGKFAGENALAAVGASYPITMIFMAVAIGSNVGCSVVISQLFGAKEMERMKTAVSTTVITALALSALLTGVGVLTVRPMMLAIQTPEEIFADGATYLSIYIWGFPFLFLYNVATGVFNSLGDSRTPLVFLIASSVANVGLDALFVIAFKLGVAGVAWATFLCQGVACVLALITVAIRLRSVPSGAYPRWSWRMLRNISHVAVPSILQQSFVSVGNIFIQGLVNSCGTAVIAGYAAGIKLNNFTITCCSTMGSGISGYTAQNVGAGKHDRVKAGVLWGWIMTGVICLSFTALYLLAGQPLIRLFMPKGGGAEATEVGVTLLRIITPFYLVVGTKLVFDGVLRGAGSMASFMIATFTDLILRVVLAFILCPIYGSTGIWLSWPIGWGVACVISFSFYRFGNWRRKKVI